MPTTTEAQNVPMKVLPGVCPDTDSTKSATRHYTFADKIRFVKGLPQKLNGWKSVIMNGAAIEGCIRAIFSSNLNDKVQTILGGSKALYALIGSELVNITPLNVNTLPLPDSLDTHFGTLANNPFHVTAGSNEIWIDDAEAALFVAGDLYVLSGATAFAGITTGDLNKIHIIREIGTGQVKIKTPATANATTAGGGNAVERSSGLLTVNAVGHAQQNGQRVKISDAVDVGGIIAADINLEFQIRNVLPDSFDVMTGGTATSAETAGGGDATKYQQEIADGICDEMNGQGYGMGRYGVGLYGTALVSTNGRRYPRIWSLDAFGDNIIASPGEGQGVYSWDGSLSAAPVPVPNAPAQVNYAFVSDNILVTLGADGDRNKIKASDIGNITEWTASSINQVFEDYIEGAGRLWSHVSLNGTNLIFTSNQCYTFRYIGLPFVWEIKFKDNIGTISQMARCVVKGVAYWMGQNNFYMWRGGNIEIIPSNSSSETTLLNYVFKNINRAQASKCFAWYNERYDEIWFHYPSEGSLEIDRVARYHVTEKHWTPDTFDRLAAEYPNINLQYPRLIDSNGVLYRHEVGTDDDEDAMAFTLTTNLRDFGTENVLQSSIVPDSVQTENIMVKVDAFSYPQSPVAKNTKTEPVAPNTEYITLDIDGRFLQYTFTGAALGQIWIMGQWLEPVQESSKSE